MERMKTHENQITDYPKGARIEAIREIPLCSPTQNYYADPLPQGTRGTVTAHTDDGRAWINFDGQGQGLLGHTFEQPEKYIRVVCTHRDDNCPANHDQISSTSDDAPAAPERGEWEVECQKVLVATPQRLRVVIRETTGAHRVIVSEDSPARFEQALIDFERIATEHNQHSILIAQREQLLAIARDALRFREEVNGKCDHDQMMTKLCSQCEIRKAITTSEQEGRW